MREKQTEFTSTWPGDPVSAWREAGKSPQPYERLTDAPDLDGADAFSISDWVSAQRSPLPLLGTVFFLIGAALAVQLIVRTQTDGPQSWWIWGSTAAMLGAGVVLWAWEISKRRARRIHPPLLPDAETVLCELHTTGFLVNHDDGYRETCVAIDAAASDAQAARIFTAFQIWLDALQSDPALTLAARSQWHPHAATVFAAEEIFGPDASGGFLVRRPNPPADGWGAIVTPRRPRSHIGQLRYADVLRWRADGWSR